MNSHTIRRATLTALMFTALAGSAAAETTPPPAPERPRTEQSQDQRDRSFVTRRWRSGGMMHMLGLAEMRPGMKIEYTEGRLAFLKAELELTDAQGKAWDAFAAAIRDNAAKLNAVYEPMERRAVARMNPVERLGWEEKTLAARLDAAKRARAALEPLYTSLSDEQKSTFDRLVPTAGRFAAMRERIRQRIERHRGEHHRGEQPNTPPAPPKQQ